MNYLSPQIDRAKICRVFISHAWSYKETYWAIIDMLNKAEAQYVDFRYADYSIPEHDPILNEKGNLLFGERNLREAIKSKIQQSSVLLVPARMYVNHSDWIKTEIKFARSMNTRVVAIKFRATKRAPIDLCVAADETIDANYRSLFNAIADPKSILVNSLRSRFSS